MSTGGPARGGPRQRKIKGCLPVGPDSLKVPLTRAKVPVLN